MKNKQKLCSIVLASATLFFMFSILISSVVSASQVAAQVTRIGNGSDPAIYGSKVVWTDSGVIHIYDLTSKTDTTVSSSAASHPAIYGNKLVWHDESSGVPRLTVYDISSGARSDITKDIDNSSIPAIYGNRIVWSANYSVYMRDISTSTQTWIAQGEYPDIYDTKIVYSSNVWDIQNIFMYDITTKKNELIDPNTGEPGNSHIYGNKVIWSDFIVIGGYIQMYDLVTKKTIDVTSNSSAANTLSGYGDAGSDTGHYIDINGDKIVYSKSGDDQFGYAGVYVYDIPSAKSTPVYIYQGTLTPDIYNDIIVWGMYDRGGVNGNGIYMSDLTATNTLPPIAEFIANVTSGTVPLVVQFFDISTGGVPTSWYWDTGDGIYSKHATNATHTFTDPGMYNVTLTVANEAGSSTVTKTNYITVTPPQPPVADFSTNATYGTAPLTVMFFATGNGGATSKVEEPRSWYWDFGDGANSNGSIAIHKFTKSGDYTISLIVENAIGNNTTTKPGYIVVTDPNAPVANFNSNVTEGYAPLTVQFNDISQKATSRTWDFNGDGQTDSNDINPVYVYANAGTYTANLTVRNENGTASKTAIINVLTPSSSSGESSHSGSSGGGGSVSPEPASNVEVKELSQATVINGKTVKFDFTKNATCVVYVNFDAKKTFGKTTTIAEQLKGKSALVSGLPKGEVYEYFNVWVGNGGVATSKNIENPVVCFKVEKSWLQDKKIDQASITLNSYSDKTWSYLPVKLLCEDNRYLYFTAEPPKFSSFAITGTVKSSEGTVPGMLLASTETTNNTTSKEPQTEQKEILRTPGFEVYYGIASLFAVLLYKRR